MAKCEKCHEFIVRIRPHDALPPVKEVLISALAPLWVESGQR